MQGETTDTIPTTLRLLLVIEDIARAGAPVAPSDVTDRLGLPKPTIHRLFATLEQEGFLQRDIDGRTYSPGPRLRVMAGGVMSSLRIRTARIEILKRLARQVGETCNIALPDRDGMLYLERVETEWPLRIQLPIGSKVPFHCTASGKMYLSSLRNDHLNRFLEAAELAPRTDNTITDRAALRGEITTVRKQGYAEDNEEFMADMVALAVPVLDANGRLSATLSFHAPTQRFDIARARAHLNDLHASAHDLSQLIR